MYNTEHIFFSWVSLCPLMLNASTQKFKFSMNSLPPFFLVCLDSLIYLLDVNQICICTSCSCSGPFTLKFYYKQICILSESWLIMCRLQIVLKNYMLNIQVFNKLCLFSTEILMKQYILIELESNHTICWYCYWISYILKTAVTKLFAIDNNFLSVIL